MPGWHSRHTERGHTALEGLVGQVVHEDLDVQAHPELPLLLEDRLYRLQEFLLGLEQRESLSQISAAGEYFRMICETGRIHQPIRTQTNSILNQKLFCFFIITCETQSIH